jgi:hypothetical protein
MDMKAISNTKAIVALESATDYSMTFCTLEYISSAYTFTCSKNIDSPFV